MSRLVLVTYDISNPRRLRRVFKAMKGFGQHVQLSVFLCELTDIERLDMIALLRSTILQVEDQILLIDLGPTHGRSAHIQALGRPLSRQTRGPHIA